jgi:L-amino acid N-acyltransferase YncA
VEPAVIRPALDSDAGTIAAIYNHYVRETIVTFEAAPVSAMDMTARLAETRASALPWLVAEIDGRVVGYAYASRWKGRCAYRHSAESTVYLDPAHVGLGHGRRLYARLFEQLWRAGMHVVIGGIALPNEASVALHERMGMRKVAHFSEVGYKFGQWIDVGYWQITRPAPTLEARG